MGFCFEIEKANKIYSSGLYLLDGVLRDGEIIHGARGYISESPELKIVIKHVGLVNPPQQVGRLTLSIEKPEGFLLNDLVGKMLVSE